MKYPWAHPGNVPFSLSKKIFSGSKYPKHILFNSEKRSTDGNTNAASNTSHSVVLIQPKYGLRSTWKVFMDQILNSVAATRCSKQPTPLQYSKKRLARHRCKPCTRYMYRRTSNYWIAWGEKRSVYRGTQGSTRSACGPNENLKERLNFCS